MSTTFDRNPPVVTYDSIFPQLGWKLVYLRTTEYATLHELADGRSSFAIDASKSNHQQVACWMSPATVGRLLNKYRNHDFNTSHPYSICQ